jgi:hypothetical protein
VTWFGLTRYCRASTCREIPAARASLSRRTSQSESLSLDEEELTPQIPDFLDQLRLAVPVAADCAQHVPSALAQSERDERLAPRRDLDQPLGHCGPAHKVRPLPDQIAARVHHRRPLPAPAEHQPRAGLRQRLE